MKEQEENNIAKRLKSMLDDQENHERDLVKNASASGQRVLEREEQLNSLSPEKREVYDRIKKIRDRSGSVDFDIVETLREMRGYPNPAIDQLREALQYLLDAQNGPPLETPRNKKFWEDAVERAQKALDDTEKYGGQ